MSDPEKSEEFEPHDPNEWDERLANQAGGVREVLQGVEDALVDAGYDDFVVVTKHGSFRWQTVDRAREDAKVDTATENLRAAWNALRIIREAVETLGPPGAMRSEEAVLATLGPEPTHEAQAIIEGIQALAGASQASVWTRVAGEDADNDIVVLTNAGPPEQWRVEHLDADGDTGLLVANFSGPGAQKCAKLFTKLLRDAADIPKR